jgi:sulfonate transport system ATP-binding protein
MNDRLNTAVAFAPTQTKARGKAPTGLSVRIEKLCKSFGARTVLREVDLQIEAGEFVTIVGRSGCGKSTLLRHLAGLESADSGQIRFDDAATPHRADAQQSDVRFMYQDARLLPWRRVLDNVALGLKGGDAKSRALQALEEVGLADRAGEWPSVLSGGQRQRVALARALVHRPRLLLLDEPLGALDALTRVDMQALIERVWREHGFTALLVTHDVGEAVALGDRVVLIEDHRVSFDEPVRLPRPRSRGKPQFAALEDRVLQRVLAQPLTEPSTGLRPDRDAALLGEPPHWQFAL